jgi:hypothetical protein
MLFVMADEGKIDRDISVEIYRQMRELARTRGYLLLPWEKQQQGEGERQTWLTE